MARAVFDSSAVIALLRKEPGAELISEYVGDALISTVNLQEAIKFLLEEGAPPELAEGMLETAYLEHRDHTAADAWTAAQLSAATRRKGSGLGDRSCMALAISEGLPAITTDRQWADLEIEGLTVILAR